MSRVLCPVHQDHEPSMQEYPDGLFCWVCRVQLTYDEYYRLTGMALRQRVIPTPKPKEDIAHSLRYIDSLPKAAVRGFQLPTDDVGYYLVWPDRTYYKRRNYSELGPRYTGPSGHRAPLLIANPGLTVEEKGQTLLIVEGEINALSVAAACPELGVCSPGSAGDFTRKDHLGFYLKYRRQVLMMDEDDAGAIGAIGLAGLLRPLSPDVQIIMSKKQAKGGQGDPNEIFQEAEGRQKLRESVFKRIQASVIKAV